MKIKLMNDFAVVPKRATTGSAGYDLCAAINESVTINPGETVKIPSGIAIEIPRNDYVALIFARSSLGIKKGLVPANAVGVIDSDYRGEIIVALHNHSSEQYTVKPKERIAQMVLVNVGLPELLVCDELSDTQRGEGGFGSTGKI
jgi:dUTP pyrophosphatase